MSSFLNLYNSLPTKERIKIEGGQTQGAVARTNEKLSVNKYTPTLGKGTEYATKMAEEQDRAYLEVNYDSVHKHAYILTSYLELRPPQIQKSSNNFEVNDKITN